MEILENKHSKNVTQLENQINLKNKYTDITRILNS